MKKAVSEKRIASIFLARRFSSFFFYPEDGSDMFLLNVG
jgi:hypothetical protein